MMIRNMFRNVLLVFCLVAGSVGLAACDSLPTSEQALAEDRDSQVAQLLRIGDSTRDAGDLTSAVGVYRRAHTLAPKQREPLMRLGATFHALGEHSDAASAFAQVVELNPSDAEALYGEGKALSALDQNEEAVERFRAAIEADSSDARFYIGLGVALDYLGEHAAAQKTYADGLRVAPDHLGLRNNLGFSLLLSGDLGGAVAQFEDIAHHPLATARHRQNLALAYGLAGQTEKAAAVARRDLPEAAVEHNLAVYQSLRNLPDDQRAREILGLRGNERPAS